MVEDDRTDKTDNAEVIKSLTEGSTLDSGESKSDNSKDRDKKSSKHSHKDKDKERDRDRKSNKDKEHRIHRSSSKDKERYEVKFLLSLDKKTNYISLNHISFMLVETGTGVGRGQEVEIAVQGTVTTRRGRGQGIGTGTGSHRTRVQDIKKTSYRPLKSWIRNPRRSSNSWSITKSFHPLKIVSGSTFLKKTSCQVNAAFFYET